MTYVLGHLTLAPTEPVMSIYHRRAEPIAALMAKAAYPAGERLALDLEALLIGPTCGAEAKRLVALMLSSTPPAEVADYLREVADRFDAMRAREHEAPPAKLAARKACSLTMRDAAGATYLYTASLTHHVALIYWADLWESWVLFNVADASRTLHKDRLDALEYARASIALAPTPSP